jgi:hypothetical protein
MLVRIGIALAGAIVVTFGLLLVMDTITDVFRDGDTTKYFRISDVFAKPDNLRPDRPEAVALPPKDTEAETNTRETDARVPIEAPTGAIPAPLLPRPELAPDTGQPSPQ